MLNIQETPAGKEKYLTFQIKDSDAKKWTFRLPLEDCRELFSGLESKLWGIAVRHPAAETYNG